jgi:CheY-like chemotaxis protein
MVSEPDRRAIEVLKQAERHDFATSSCGPSGNISMHNLLGPALTVVVPAQSCQFTILQIEDTPSDVALTVLDGYDVLTVIKSDEALKSIPVIVFSTFDTEESRKVAYLHHADSYVAKPMEFAAFSAMIQSVAAYWFKLGGFVEPPGAVEKNP